MRFARTFAAVFAREWRVNLRGYRIGAFALTFLSTLSTLLTGYFLYVIVFQGRLAGDFVEAAGTRDYVTYLVVGVTSFGFTLRILAAIQGYVGDYWLGTLPHLVLASAPSLAYNLATTAFAALFACLEMGLLLAVAALGLGVDFSHLNGLSLAYAALASLFGLFGLNVLLTAIVLQGRDNLVPQPTVNISLQLLSGALFPISYLPMPLQWLAPLLPLTWALRMLRAAILTGAPPVELNGDALALVVVGTAYTVAGTWYLRRIVQRRVEQPA